VRRAAVSQVQDAAPTLRGPRGLTRHRRAKASNTVSKPLYRPPGRRRLKGGCAGQVVCAFEKVEFVERVTKERISWWAEPDHPLSHHTHRWRPLPQ